MAAGPLPFESVVAIAVVVVYRGMMTGNKRDCGEPGLFDRGETYESLRRDRTFNRRAGEVGDFIYAKTLYAKRQNKMSRYKYICMDGKGTSSRERRTVVLSFCSAIDKKKKRLNGNQMFPIVFYCRWPTVGECRVGDTYTLGLYIYFRGTRDSRARTDAWQEKNTESSPIVCFFKANGVFFWSRRGQDRQSIKTGSVRLNRDHSGTIDFPLSADVSVLRFFPNLPKRDKNVFHWKISVELPSIPPFVGRPNDYKVSSTTFFDLAI